MAKSVASALTGNLLVAYSGCVPTNEQPDSPPDDTDAVFKALADPYRRLILDRLREDGGLTVVGLCAGSGMTRQAVSKHLAILEAASLVSTTRRGREKLHFLNPVPIQDIHQRWISKYDASRLAALGNLKYALENQERE